MTVYHPNVYKIALSLIPNLNCILAHQLVGVAGDVVELFNQANYILSNHCSNYESLLKSFTSVETLNKAVYQYNIAMDRNISLCFCTDKHYPNKLRECDDAPLLVYSVGNINFVNCYMLSIVGTRKPDANAQRYIDNFIADLRQYRQDIVIVSGLASGVDTIAHETAIKYGFKTVAVMGTGFDHIYPTENTDLAKRIIDTNGALLTEYEYGHPISPDNFPQRNRIVAGLCDALLVVQSPIRGGSLLTATLANSYNRDVFAFPGRPDDELFAGCNHLIRNNCAALITSAEDFAYYVGWNRE